jgi:hypothetical protein
VSPGTTILRFWCVVGGTRSGGLPSQDASPAHHQITPQLSFYDHTSSGVIPEHWPSRESRRQLLGTTRFQHERIAAYPAVIRGAVDYRQELPELHRRQPIEQDANGVIDLPRSPIVHSSSRPEVDAVASLG